MSIGVGMKIGDLVRHFVIKYPDMNHGRNGQIGIITEVGSLGYKVYFICAQEEDYWFDCFTIEAL